MSLGLSEYFRATIAQLYTFSLTIGGPGLFFIALADSSFLSIPEANDLLIVVLSTGQSWAKMAYFVTMTILGSAAGCTLLYNVGREGGAFIAKRFNQQKMARVEALYRQWGLWSIIIPCLLPPPTPFKVFVFAAGLFGTSFPKFLLAIIVGRSVRYYVWGILAVLYGDAAKVFLENNLHTVGIILFALLVVAIVAYISVKLKKKTPQQEPA